MYCIHIKYTLQINKKYVEKEKKENIELYLHNLCNFIYLHCIL